jgi:8-oxo-dGTP pyrophosphatase MutT (NUDIX family)
MAISIHRILETNLTLSDGPWPFAEQNAVSIAEAWAEALRRTPAMFNGRVLVLTEGRREGTRFVGSYTMVDYSAFFHYLRAGHNDGSTRNAFSLAALTASDDSLVLGLMGQNTANAGRIYFPGGTPDAGDIFDGRVNLTANALRELEEETGIGPEDIRPERGYILVEAGTRLAFMKIMRSPLDGPSLARKIEANLVQRNLDELAGVRLIRSADDIDEAIMPEFQCAYIRWWFKTGRYRPRLKDSHSGS